MNVYLAYKFSHIKDKKTLIGELEHLAKHFEAQGHKVFLLGRDVHKWNNHKNPITTLFHVVKNLKKSDALVAYVTSDKKSHGLDTEIFIARIMGKKQIHLVHEKISIDEHKDKANKIFIFNSLDDIKTGFEL